MGRSAPQTFRNFFPFAGLHQKGNKQPRSGNRIPGIPVKDRTLVRCSCRRVAVVEEAERTRQKSLNSWIRESLPKALAFARSLEADRHAAEDLVHECICRLLEREDQYDLPRDGFKLLVRSITNACIDRSRRRGRIRWRTGLDAQCDGAYEFVDTRSVEPFELAVHKELETAVGAALRHLPLNQRAALELKSLGCSLSEIAETLEISESHAGVLVHRARRALSQELKCFLHDV